MPTQLKRPGQGQGQRTYCPSRIQETARQTAAGVTSSVGTLDLLPPPGARTLPDFQLIEMLGRGGFGEVWRATGPGGIEVALKFIQLGGETGLAELRALDLMKNIRHPHLLPLFGAWQCGEQLILAMELA